MSDMQYSDKSKLVAKPDQVEQGPENAPSISPMRIQRLGAMDLQRLVGNKATQRLLRQADTSRPSVIQTKMTVGAADDAYEQEADKVASQVVSDSPSPVQREDDSEAIQTMRIQREVPEEEDQLQAKRADSIQREVPEEEDQLQAKRSDSIQREGDPEEEEPIQTMRIQREDVDMMDSFDAGADVESGIANTRGSGQALPDDTRGMMESKMGYDFSGVNIHTDSQSNSLNRAVSAKAFTTGSDVYFSEGSFNPGSKDGQQLLAHELTHVVQQGGAAPKVQTEREDK